MTEEFDLEKETWTRMPWSDMGKERYDHVCFTAKVGDKVKAMVFGGWNFAADANTLETYDPDTLAWTTMKSDATKVMRSQRLTVGNKIRTFGGVSCEVLTSGDTACERHGDVHHLSIPEDLATEWKWNKATKNVTMSRSSHIVFAVPKSIKSNCGG